MENKIKIKKTKKEMDWFEAICPYCEKVVEGFYDVQVLKNMTTHMLNCKAVNKKEDNKNE